MKAVLHFYRNKKEIFEDFHFFSLKKSELVVITTLQ
jgi:hypothetical protein